MLSDSAIDTQVWHNTNLDPLELDTSVDQSKTLIRCYLFAPREVSEVDWYHGVWQKCSYPTLNKTLLIEAVDKDERGLVYGCGFEIDLAELVAGDGVKILSDKIMEYRDALLGHE